MPRSNYLSDRMVWRRAAFARIREIDRLLTTRGQRELREERALLKKELREDER